MDDPGRAVADGTYPIPIPFCSKGDKFPLVREQYPRFKLFNRYAMNLEETFIPSLPFPSQDTPTFIPSLLITMVRHLSGQPVAKSLDAL